MSVVILLMLASLAVGLVFVGAFVWSVRSGQYEDTLTPSMRVLLDDATTENAAVPRTPNSAVSQVSKPAARTDRRRAANLEIGDTAGLETGGTPPPPTARDAEALKIQTLKANTNYEDRNIQI